MKFTTIAVFSLLVCLPLQFANAEEISSIADSQLIVAITDDEGIYYSRGCAFYELRDLISESAKTLAEPTRAPDDAIIEVRLLGVDGESTLFVGDHWISSSDGSALLSDSIMSQVLELVQARKGSGVRQSKIEATTRSALAKIQSPTYVEEDRCTNR